MTSHENFACGKPGGSKGSCDELESIPTPEAAEMPECCVIYWAAQGAFLHMSVGHAYPQRFLPLQLVWQQNAFA